MAALANVAEVLPRFPWGRYFAKVLRVPSASLGTASATEWVAKADIGFEVISYATPTVKGATVSDVALQYNAQGTGVAEDVNKGDLGVEVEAAGIGDLDLLVVGR